MDKRKDVPGTADSGIDFQAVLDMTGGDVELLRELAHAFLTEAPRQILSLRSAIDERDTELLRHAAHQFQGVSRCLHIGRATQQARQLELLGEGTVDWQAAESQVAILSSTIESATGTLNEFLRERA